MEFMLKINKGKADDLLEVRDILSQLVDEDGLVFPDTDTFGQVRNTDGQIVGFWTFD